jgi:SAM-dependent methyltransferase
MRLFVDKLRSAVTLVMPSPLRRIAREYLSQRWDTKYEGRPVEEIFSALYRERKWGTNPDSDFSSGTGSHVESVVLPYVNAVRGFLESLPRPPSVVDLGCGDFNVGKELRPFCGRYVACDVVPALIQRNKDRFADLQVDFRCIDIIDDDLPDGDIAFLRQVLQHLSNAQILKLIDKLYRYKFLVLTEHVPTNSDFPPNRDKATGGRVRLPQGSGVVLTEPPFLLSVKSESVLCTTNQSLDQYSGLIKTTLYDLQVV